MADDPRWPTAQRWLAGEHFADVRGTLGIIGLPVHAGAVTPGRCDLAPAAFRHALARLSCHDLAADVDLRELDARDHGDAIVADFALAAMAAPAQAAVRAALAEATATLVLGGHDAITRPACLAIASAPARCALLTLDAHLDLRDLDTGLSNGNPVRALLADGVPGRQIVELGLQPFANSRDYAAVARAAGITTVTVETWRARGIVATVDAALAELAQHADAIHVDVDLDVLDRAFAPAAAGSRPGGLRPDELLAAVRAAGRHPRVRSLGIVECDPTRDVADATVLAGALAAVQFAAGVVERLRGH